MFLRIVTVSLLLIVPSAPAADDAAAERLFAVQILPLLKTKCLACHGEDAQKLKGGFNLSTRAGLLKGGESGTPGIVSGKPADSPVYLTVTRSSADWPAMPPKENDKLTTADLTALRAWIAGGAPWPTDDRVRELVRQADTDGVTVATSGGQSPDWTNRRYKPADLWAYQPLMRPLIPAHAANAVDALIEAPLSELGLSPAPPADRRTLIRRATFDLIGLPPTPEEVEAFVADPAPESTAFAKVVDRLLASPHYGEHWGRHWLDVVRYADTAGFANDYDRGNAWRYRDYVVRSLNADKPYDRFVREQLAGDEIDPNDPEMRVAVGFLRMGPWELTGMEVAKVARQRFLDDVTDTVGQVFLAHPLQCARCHDHKFDPVPTRDYYRIQAAFATTQVTDRPSPFLPSENTAGFEEKKYLLARRERYEAESERIRGVEAKKIAEWRATHPDRKGEKPPRDEYLSARDLGLERIARKGLERLKWELDRYEPIALSVYSGRTPVLKSVNTPLRPPKDPRTAGTLEVTHILTGGDPFAPKDIVTPGVLSAAQVPAVVPSDIEGRRRALAQWITDPSNAITWRVMANRVWQWHFGTPLAGNPNNFGATGKKPTHPALLDWLAVELRDNGMSLKKLNRTIMTSAAYRRSSHHPAPADVAAKDPENTRYAVFRSRRLTAEELRDAMLAASGELNQALGGIPVRPDLNPDVALQPRQVMGTFAPAWQPSPRPDQRNRRSLYVQQVRGLRDPYFEVFGQPSADTPCEARDTATVAPQAFALFNGATTTARALALANRVQQEANTKPAVIDRLFRRTLGRAPSTPETAACLQHWEAMTERHRKLTFTKPAHPREVVREAVEENTGVKFTFTEVLEAAVDYVPDPHPADSPPDVRGLMEVALVLLNSNEFAYLD